MHCPSVDGITASPGWAAFPGSICALAFDVGLLPTRSHAFPSESPWRVCCFIRFRIIVWHYQRLHQFGKFFTQTPDVRIEFKTRNQQLFRIPFSAPFSKPQYHSLFPAIVPHPDAIEGTARGRI